MKIACCLFKYFPYGGLARDFATIATELVKRGHRVTAYVLDWEGDCIPGVQTVRLGRNSGTNHGRIVSYVKALEKNLSANPADTVLGFNKMPFLDWYYVADVCYVAKVDQEKHGLKRFLYTRSPRYRAFSSFERAVFGSSSQTRILFIDEVQKINFDRYYPESVLRFNVLPPFVGSSALYSNFSERDIAQKRADDGMKDDNIQIIQVGSDFSRKGLDRTFQAIAAMPEKLRLRMSLKVIGQDDSRRFQELAKRLGIEKLVRFLGGIPNSGLDIAAADIFIHPAYTENTGTVILEAVTSTTPQIVTSICGYAHYVREAQSGILIEEPFDQKKLNNALYQLATEPKLRNILSNNAKLYIDKHRDMLDNMAKNVVDLLEQNN